MSWRLRRRLTPIFSCAHEALSDERDELNHQVDVGIAEREGARQLAARVEAELEQLRRRHTEQQDTLATKLRKPRAWAGSYRPCASACSTKRRCSTRPARGPRELSATAAKGHEQGRMLTEVARDRDHLREELTRRSAEIDRLEERAVGSPRGGAKGAP